VLLHQFGEDLVLAEELGLEFGDLLLLGVGVVLAAFVVDGEGGLSVLEEGLLPEVEEIDGDTVSLTKVGDRDFIDEVFSEQGDLLLGRVGATLPGHECSSARVLPLTLTKANSCFD
jgi:hypothetical protein